MLFIDAFSLLMNLQVPQRVDFKPLRLNSSQSSAYTLKRVRRTFKVSSKLRNNTKNDKKRREENFNLYGPKTSAFKNNKA